MARWESVEGFDSSRVTNHLIRLVSFISYPIHEIASKLTYGGLSFDCVNDCLVCSSCDFKIPRHDVCNTRVLLEFVSRHRERCGNWRPLDGEDYVQPELASKRTDRTKTDDYKALASHLTTKGVTVDARMIKARVDMQTSVFLLNKGFKRNTIKLAHIIQLSCKGKDFDSVNELMDMMFNLEEAEVDVIYPEFEKLMYMPSMKVVVQSKSGDSTVQLSSAAPTSATPLSARVHSKHSISSILKSIPRTFGYIQDRSSKKSKNQVKTDHKSAVGCCTNPNNSIDDLSQTTVRWNSVDRRSEGAAAQSLSPVLESH